MDSTPDENTSMYDTIMSLPLFKGVSRDHVSYFLEKTPVNFIRSRRGDSIAVYGEKVEKLRFLISGKIKIRHKAILRGIEVCEDKGPGCVLGADRLFGMHTTYDADVTAVEDSGIMEFTKEQYFNLIRSDSIYLLNFLNFLSLRVQRNDTQLPSVSGSGLASLLGRLLVQFTDRHSQNIEIEFSDDILSALKSEQPVLFARQKELLETSGAVRMIGSRFLVPDRELIIQIARRELRSESLS